MSVSRHLRAIALLPLMGTVAVPGLVVWLADGVNVGWGLSPVLAALAVVLGLLLIGLGLWMVAWTIALFAAVGRGTLAPWDPTARLVVRGPYRRVRNPMISGVLAILLGEAVLLGSPPLLIWFAAFFAANAVWLPLVEERGLRRRFGADYDDYRAHVGRWVPRARAWTPTAR